MQIISQLFLMIVEIISKHIEVQNHSFILPKQDGFLIIAKREFFIGE